MIETVLFDNSMSECLGLFLLNLFHYDLTEQLYSSIAVIPTDAVRHNGF